MIKEFRLPDLGEGLTESEIVSWHVAVGDTVELNQVIADVETAKAVVELPSPYAGVIARLHEQPGTVVEVGATIVSFDIPVIGNEADPPARREPNLVGYGAAVEKGGRPQRRVRDFAEDSGSAAAVQPMPDRPAAARSVPAVPAVPAHPAAVPVAPTHAAPAAAAPARQGPAPDSPVPAVRPAHAAPLVSATGERPRSTPPVRKLARDLGLVLDSVHGSGPGQLITREDVLNALAEQGGSAAGTVGYGPGVSEGAAGTGDAVSDGRGLPPASGETRIPIKGVRKHTAAAMVASAFTAPHVTEFLTIDVTPTMELISKLKASRAFADARITPLTIVAKAVCIAVRRQPSLNSSWDAAANEIVQYSAVNLGIAAATPRGLLVPNIKDAGALNLLELSAALKTLTDTARSGKTSQADLSGGTLSITNIGVFGIDAGTPILNPGEAAILAVGAVRRAPWEYEGEVALRSVMPLSLSFDHRLVDGEQGSRFLADIGAILSDPGMVLTMV
ncbi:dihydrolipoamide acetyltransferase family protein [Arthrobacter sp. Br18]|uniref:dihydrolipoamide acetyltransferase family protein n=1 Tax=Arthrobacter sp. Br18 TaxID=1312954 RepID=UPI00047AC8FB|nr:dihydrolipoamide acetyltransferase family protein [Arthrobacter sp. Br18]